MEKSSFKKDQISKVYVEGIDKPLEEGRDKDYVVVDRDGTILSRLFRASGESGVSIRLTEKYLNSLDKGQTYVLRIVMNDAYTKPETNPTGVFSAKFEIAAETKPTPDPTPGKPSGSGSNTENGGGSTSETKTYSILNEAGSYNINQGGTYTIRIDAEHQKFRSVKVDGNTVAGSHYTTWSGSTYVRFTQEFMSELALGERKIEVVFSDGTAVTSVKIVSHRLTPTEIVTVQNQVNAAPKTGDASKVVLWLTMSAVCCGAFLFLNNKKMKREENS